MKSLLKKTLILILILSINTSILAVSASTILLPYTLPDSSGYGVEVELEDGKHPLDVNVKELIYRVQNLESLISSLIIQEPLDRIIPGINNQDENQANSKLIPYKAVALKIAETKNFPNKVELTSIALSRALEMYHARKSAKRRYADVKAVFDEIVKNREYLGPPITGLNTNDENRVRQAMHEAKAFANLSEQGFYYWANMYFFLRFGREYKKQEPALIGVINDN